MAVYTKNYTRPPISVFLTRSVFWGSIYECLRLLQPLDQLIEPFPVLGVCLPNHVLTVTLVSGDIVNVEMEHVLLSGLPSAADDLDVFDPQFLPV